MATQQPAGGVETQQQAQIEYEKYGRIESHAPMWRTGTRFDLYAYLSTNNRSFEKREVSNNEHDTMIMVLTPISLFPCYAMLGTDIAYLSSPERSKCSTKDR